MKRTIAKNEDGATVVEFGLLIPVILGSFLGVLQAGISMMNYNSLRNLSAETSRFALVQYQSSNELTNEDIEADGTTRAPGHGFDPSRFTIEVTTPATQRIEGATELTITTSYNVVSVLPFLGIDDFTVTFERPLFLIDEEDSSEEGSEITDEDDSGTDFGEGGVEEPTDPDDSATCELADSSCDHDHGDETL
jgi:hypothetical protein